MRSLPIIYCSKPAYLSHGYPHAESLCMNIHMRKQTILVSDTNRPVQSQKPARSENKGADQLRGYREAGRLPRSWSAPLLSRMQIFGFRMRRLIL